MGCSCVHVDLYPRALAALWDWVTQRYRQGELPGRQSLPPALFCEPPLK